MRARTILGAAAVATLAAFAGIASAATVTITQTPQGNEIVINGTAGNDTIELANIPGVGDPNERFYEIHDPAGIPDPVPPGCFRFDANTIHCPVEGVSRIEIDLKGGNDEVAIGPNVVDELDIEGDAGNDDLEGGENIDDLEGDEGRDVIDGGPGADEQEGGPGNDRLLASPGNDRQFGEEGADLVSGGAGNDRQKGGAGADRIIGGGGRDSQDGGPGRDRCNGGPANDSARRCEIGANY
jgi:Ca2+-binding RTX toxin-like protein